MRRMELGGVGTAVLAGLILSAVAMAGDPPPDDTSPTTPSTWGGSMHSSSWFKGMFGTEEKKEQEQKKEPESAPLRKDKAPAKNLAPAPKPADQASRAASERGQEQAALLRRLAVCDQLKLIAYQTKDDALLHRAEQLEDRAQSLYNQRISHLPASRAVVAPTNASTEKSARSTNASDNTLHSTSLPSVTDKAAAVTGENKS